MYRRIRDLREDRDLLQRDLAAYLQCSQVCYAKLDDRHFTITAEVRVSDPFFSWVCTFGRRAKILYPDSVVADFKFYLDKIRKMYDT